MGKETEDWLVKGETRGAARRERVRAHVCVCVCVYCCCRGGEKGREERKARGRAQVKNSGREGEQKNKASHALAAPRRVSTAEVMQRLYHCACAEKKRRRSQRGRRREREREKEKERDQTKHQATPHLSSAALTSARFLIANAQQTVAIEGGKRGSDRERERYGQSARQTRKATPLLSSAVLSAATSDTQSGCVQISTISNQL